MHPRLDPGFDNHVFVAGEPVSMRLRLEGAPRGPTPPGLRYTVLDLHGNAVASGSTGAVIDRSGEFLLDKLPASVGWYRVTFAYDGRRVHETNDVAAKADINQISYSVVPNSQSTVSVDSFIGIDAAFSSASALTARQSVRLARLAGVGWVRDRISLAAAFPTPKTRNFAPALENATLAKAAGLSVLQVFADNPDWTRRPHDRRMSSNLDFVYQLGVELGKAFEGSVDAWEIWNEHDIDHFGGDTPDRYAAFLKAFSLGLRDTSRALRVLGPFGRNPAVGGYGTTIFNAGVAEYLDVYSFHTYAGIENGAFQEALDLHRRLRVSGGFSNKPFWITETGRALRSGTPAFGEDSVQQAAYAVKAFAIARAAGTQRMFWFVLKPFVTGSREFGLLTQSLTPSPCYQALAILASKLGTAEYEGRIEVASGVEIHLFSDRGRKVAVAWADRDQEVSLQVQPGAQLTRVMGASESVRNANIKVGPMPVFLDGFVWPDVSKTEDIKATAQATSIVDETLVLSTDLPGSGVSRRGRDPGIQRDGLTSDWSPRGYILVPGKEATLNINVYNFSAAAKRCTLRFHRSKGLDLDLDQVDLEVPAMGSSAVSVRLRWSSPSRGSSGVVRVSGTANGRPIPDSELQLASS